MAIVLYVWSVLECALMLVNLLIAIFSHQVEDVYRYKHEIQSIIKITMLMNLRALLLTWLYLVAKITRKPAIANKHETIVIRIAEKKATHRDEI